MIKQIAKITFCSLLVKALCSCGGAEEPKKYEDKVVGSNDIAGLAGAEKKRLLQDWTYVGAKLLHNSLSSLRVVQSLGDSFEGKSSKQDIASGLAITTETNCSYLGDVGLDLFIENENGETPYNFSDFDKYEVQAHVAFDWMDCIEFGRHDYVDPRAVAEQPERLKKDEQFYMDGQVSMNLVSRPIESGGYRWHVTALLDNMAFSSPDIASSSEPIRYEGQVDIEVITKIDEKGNAAHGDVYINAELTAINSARPDKFESLTLSSKGKISVETAGWREQFIYDLAIDATRIFNDGDTKMYRYKTKENISSDYSDSFIKGIPEPISGVMQVLTPERKLGIATFEKGKVTIDYSGSTVECSFRELIEAQVTCFVN